MVTRPAQQKRSGFTLIELVTSMAIVGFAFAVTAPSYISWANKQRLKAANEEVFSLIHRTKRTAMRHKRSQQLSLRKIGDRAEWSIHPTNTPAVNWNSLPPDVQIDPETTLRRRRGNYVLQFNDYGEVNGQLGRVTLSLTKYPKQKQCIMISTLLGKIRRGEAHQKPKRGRYCY
ncbi:Tfp pilus assembly protein FimT/FimU [Romeriopsis navalis]